VRPSIESMVLLAHELRVARRFRRAPVSKRVCPAARARVRARGHPRMKMRPQAVLMRWRGTNARTLFTICLQPPHPLPPTLCLLLHLDSLYLNGQLMAEESELPPLRRNDAPLCIGATRWGEAGWYAWHGSIGPLSIWNRCLSGDEVKRALIQPTLQAGLILNLPMEETSGTQATDTSAYNLHGSFVDSMTVIDRSTLPPYTGDVSALPWLAKVQDALHAAP